jgi:hypothetical protein
MDREASPASPSQRMGIVPLLGWAALTGLVLVIRQGALKALWDQLSGAWPAAGTLYQLIDALVLGAGLLCVCIAAKRWGEGVRILREPGEWMLFSFGGVFLMSEIVGPAVQYYLSPVSFREGLWIRWASGYGAAIVLWALPLVLLRQSPYRWYFLVCMIKNVCSLGLQCLMDFAGYSPDPTGVPFQIYGLLYFLGPLVALFYGLWRDRLQTSERGWLHKLGLSLAFLKEANLVVVNLISLLIGPPVAG